MSAACCAEMGGGGDGTPCTWSSSIITEATAHSVHLFQGPVRASLLNVPLLLSSE